jgi:superfamily I DNA/RNA helicase
MKDTLSILKTVRSLSFPVGKKLLSDILYGTENTQIKKLSLDRNPYHGELGGYQKEEIIDIIEDLIFKDFLCIDRLPQNKFLPVINLTQKGIEALNNPKGFQEKQESYGSFQNHIAQITEEDKQIFSHFGTFLERYNDNQKKAIIESAQYTLCIAGAGTGKTTVLTKRIQFLTQFKSVPQNKILAITFTRKARQEMVSRLEKLIPNHTIAVETFNSFCEKQLQKHEIYILGTNSRVIDGKTRIKLVINALKELGITQDQVLQKYYTQQQLRSKEPRTLFFRLINDLFAIMDHFRNEEKDIREFADYSSKAPDIRARIVCRLANEIIQKIVKYKKENNLRDYSDQIVNAIKLYNVKPEIIPHYTHILVDEYQDINNLQVKLLQHLDPDNLFCVGDPRQSIYGWRGSRIQYILNFHEMFSDCRIVELIKNYRSTPEIVDIANKSIKNMSLTDLKAVQPPSDKVHILPQDSEESEGFFVVQSILSQSVKRKEIFILTRTNKQADKICEQLKQHNIKFLKRSEEEHIPRKANEDEVTVSTIHAIKGLEAEIVYLIGASGNNYPCKAQEHPLLEFVIDQSYDKFDEEQRVFYVGLTRARKRLIITYYNTKTRFLDFHKESKPVVEKKIPTKPIYFGINSQSGSENYKNKISFNSKNAMQELKNWRLEKARTMNIPAYMILTDKTLLELATQKPQTIDELNMISGMGPMKIKKFGKEILSLL